MINVIPLAATGLEEKKQGWTPAVSRTRSKIAMENNKNILIINDMPGYGKVATAAMLPILSNMGHSVYNLPTALVSNTLDYGTFSILDTTDYMVQAIDAWKKLGFSFDCITTGFLASAEQVDIIREFIASQKKEGLLVMTDPIMGDDGKLYNGVTEETVENMRRLLGVADVIVPNLTEAEFLTGKYQGRESLTAGEARELVDGLLTFGPRSVVVTSGVEEETGRHVVWGYNRETGAHFTIPYQFIQVHFPGTGDMFSAVLVGELLAVSRMDQLDLVELPVIDGVGHLVGTVTADDAMDVLQDEATEDMEKMAAMLPSERPYLETRVVDLYRSRVLWLLLLMVSATFTGAIITHFETALAAQVVLTAFIPMLMDTGGNCGSQSSVTIIRGLSLGEIHAGDCLKVAWKEAQVGLLCGATLAAVNFVRLLVFSKVSFAVAPRYGTPSSCKFITVSTEAARLSPMAITAQSKFRAPSARSTSLSCPSPTTACVTSLLSCCTKSERTSIASTSAPS